MSSTETSFKRWQQCIRVGYSALSRQYQESKSGNDIPLN